MTRDELVRIVGREPVFTTGMLLGSGSDPANVRRQLSRWVDRGVVVKLRRGLYVLGEDLRRAEPHPYEVSNALVPASYVSLETVLSEMGLIPEGVFVTTAVTTGKQGVVKTPLGRYVYHHVKRSLFWGYEAREVAPGRSAFVALPEKALLDMAYLRARSDEPGFVRELRLQHLDALDLGRLTAFAARFDSRKVLRFAGHVVRLSGQEQGEFAGQ